MYLMLNSVRNPLTTILLLRSTDDKEIDSGDAKYISPD